MECILTGEGANALQAGLHARGPLVQRGGWSRPVPPARDVGAPIAACEPVDAQQGWNGSFSLRGCDHPIEKTLHSLMFANFLTNITAVSQKDKNAVLVFF